MALETATYINGLVAANPSGLDPKSQGDDHIRLLKSTIKATLPNITGAVTASQAELNILDGATLSTAELNVLDGVTASTAELNILDGVTATAAELNVLDGITSSTAELNILDGVTATASDLNTVTIRALRAGDTYTGAHDFTGAAVSVATQTAGDSSNRPASTAFVAATAFASALPGQAGNAGKFITTDGTNASWAVISKGESVSIISTNTLAVRYQTYVLTASLTLTLPATPAAGDWVSVINRSGTTTPVIARNGSNIMGLAEDLTLDSANAPVTLVYADATRGWVIS